MIALPPTSPTLPSYDKLKSRMQNNVPRIPVRYWMCGTISALVTLALLAVGSSGQHSSEQIWAKAGEVSTVLKAKTFGISVTKEALTDADYFIEKGIAPASWTHTYNPPSVSFVALRRSVRRKIVANTSTSFLPSLSNTKLSACTSM